MRSLLLKDLYVLIKQLKIFIFVIFFLSIFSGGAMSIFLILLGASLPITSIAYDEHSKWDRISYMMPYSTFNLVLSKYLLGYIFMLLVALLMLFVYLLGNIIGITFFEGNLNVLIFSIVLGLIFISINMPVFFKLGAQKGRILFVVIMGICGSLSPLLSKAGNLRFNINLSPFMFFILVIILNIISIMISVKIKKNK